MKLLCTAIPCVSEYFPAVLAWLGITGLGVVLLIRALGKEAWGWVFACLTGLAVASLLLVQSTFYPALAKERTFKPFIARVRQVVSDGAPLFFYRSFDHGALFYTRRHIPYQEKLEEISPSCFLLMGKEEWERMQGQRGLELLDISEGNGPEGHSRLVLVAVTNHDPLYGDSQSDETRNPL